MLLSRSTFLGSGQYSQHIFGGFNATVANMKASIASMFQFSLFGMTATGADVCGSFADGAVDSPQLFVRWSQLAAYYPLSRFHYVHPFILNFTIPGQSGTYQDSIFTSIRSKYSLIKYMYATIYNITRTATGSLWTPTYWNYPADTTAWAYPGNTDNLVFEQQIMIGKDVLITPSLNLNSTNKMAEAFYFPAGGNTKATWANIFNPTSSKTFRGVVDLEIPWTNNSIAYLRPGAVIPIQNAAGNKTINNTNTLLQAPTRIYLNPNDAYTAEGMVIFQDGTADKTEWAVEMKLSGADQFFKGQVTVNVNYILNGTYDG